MRASSSIVPGVDRDVVCLVLDDFGRLGLAWRENGVEDTALKLLLAYLGRPDSSRVRVIGFNTAEGWSRDVSEVVAFQVRVRCANQGRELPESLQQLVERYEGASRPSPSSRKADGNG